MSSASNARQRFSDERGFSLVQLVVVFSVIAAVTTMSVIGIKSARSSFRLQNSARVFAQNVERARLDAIRRHVNTHVEFTGASTYEISMDFTNSGTTQTRTFALDTNVSITNSDGSAVDSSSYPYADFDYRGRTYDCSMLFRMKNDRGDQAVVQVAGSGDITVNSVATSLPNINYSNVNSVTDISTRTVMNGNNNPLNLSPCGTTGVGVGSGGGSVPPPVVTCTAATVTLSTGYVTVSRNGGSSQSINVTVTGAGTVTAVPDSNLGVTPSTRSVSSSSGGTVSFTVSSVNKTRGTFPVNFYFTGCTSPDILYVKVTN